MMYFDTIQQFKKMLHSLDACLVKAAAFADHKKVPVDELSQARLAPDMFPLVKQIQAAGDAAKFCAAYLTGQTAPKHPDEEITFKEMRERIQKVLTYLETFKAEQFTQSESVHVAPGWAKGKWLPAGEFGNQVAIPNFYFHYTAAYAILRHWGVPVGKMDYLGAVNLRD